VSVFYQLRVHSHVCPYVYTSLCLYLCPVTSIKEVVLSSALVCLFVCLQDYAKTFLTNFHKNRWKGGTWATEETVKILNPYH